MVSPIPITPEIDDDITELSEAIAGFAFTGALTPINEQDSGFYTYGQVGTEGHSPPKDAKTSLLLAMLSVTSETSEELKADLKEHKRVRRVKPLPRLSSPIVGASSIGR